MGEKIIVGPQSRGLRNDRIPAFIDNESFPNLINAYQWRGRVKRKRGTSFLARLTRHFDSTSTAYSSTSTFALVAGAGNILTGFSLQTNGNIIPGSVTITDTTVAVIYTDPSMNGTLSGGAGGTINYATGAITITGGAGHSVSAVFNYYPDLPVMGEEDFVSPSTAFPMTVGFDTVYSYNIGQSRPTTVYDVSFYKNPAVDATNLPAYVPKTTWTPVTWNGQNYQQFWTTNYQGAMWTTNGITVPFTTTNIGMQFNHIVTVTLLTTTTANLQITGHGLLVGDFVFVNEVTTTTGINFQTGYVITVTDANNVIVKFPFATVTTNGAGGIAQYLTNRSDTTKDCIRWYDGDPTNGNAVTPGFSQGLGWVNFMPPLSEFIFSIADLPDKIYYLVGARMIVPFKDRLLFLGPVVQSSSGNPIYLQDTVIYSQNGTPYYTVSYKNSPSDVKDTPTSPTNTYHYLLLPANQSAIPSSYFEDQTGFGGFRSASVDQPINTVSSNEDVLIIGFSTLQARLIYSGDDFLPFNFFLINSELGSSSTFSAVNMDKGVITRGSRGFIISGQTEVSRIDSDIPDESFEINLFNNGTERICSQRNFNDEWIYFTYTGNSETSIFPNQSLQYNYRDNSWAMHFESYTTYGQFRRIDGDTWANIGLTYLTWESWNDPWNAGVSTTLQPELIAGNQQGFVIIRDVGTDESVSLYIRSFSSSVVTSPDHGLNDEDFIVISGCIGTISTQVNGKIFKVTGVTQNTFTLDPLISSGTYFGGGLIQRMYIPFIQTKQFPVAWGLARKTRLGPQQYLFSTTPAGQITLLIYLSQNADDPYNDQPIVPDVNSQNNSLIYSTVLYTCPEGINLGLTPANINLQIPTSVQQAQTWHRMNTSLIGDTVQVGFTMSESQMRDVNFNNQFAEIELHAFILDVTPSQLLV